MKAPPQIASDLMLPIIDRSFDGMALVTHSPWRLLFANRTLAGWMGKPAAELAGIPLESVFVPAWRGGILEDSLNRVRIDPAIEVESALPIEFGSAGGGTALLRVFHVTDGNPPLFGMFLRPHADIVDGSTGPFARVDPLTALPDRTFLLSRLATLLTGDRVADREFAVLFIDLDNFKQFNDRNGHLLGDRILREVARRLQCCVRDGDHVTRYGGDEFVVLLERVSDKADIEPALARIHGALAEPIELSEGRFTLSLSIGVAKSAPHLRSPDDVLGEADRQMYLAKRGASVEASNAPTL